VSNEGDEASAWRGGQGGARRDGRGYATGRDDWRKDGDALEQAQKRRRREEHVDLSTPFESINPVDLASPSSPLPLEPHYDRSTFFIEILQNGPLYPGSPFAFSVNILDRSLLHPAVGQAPPLEIIFAGHSHFVGEGRSIHPLFSLTNLERITTVGRIPYSTFVPTSATCGLCGSVYDSLPPTYEASDEANNVVCKTWYAITARLGDAVATAELRVHQMPVAVNKLVEWDRWTAVDAEEDEIIRTAEGGWAGFDLIGVQVSVASPILPVRSRLFFLLCRRSRTS
jgi:hypothetical protein